MRRFLREAAIPLIALASYGGYHLLAPHMHEAYGHVAERIEMMRESFIREPSDDAEDRRSTETSSRIDEQAAAPAATPEPIVEILPVEPLSVDPQAEPFSGSEGGRASVYAAPPEPNNTVLEPEHITEPNIIEPMISEPKVIEPTYMYDTLRTSTIARMHVIEPAVSRIAHRFSTSRETVYATLIVESSLDPRAHNVSDAKHGLGQVRTIVLENIGMSASYAPSDNLASYEKALSWISEESGITDFVTLAAIHSRTGPLVTLENYLSSPELEHYRNLVDMRRSLVTELIDACDHTPDPDLESICTIEGTITERYHALAQTSIERATQTSGSRSNAHIENAQLAIIAYILDGGSDPALRERIDQAYHARDTP